jgi:hypothetical protein
MSRFVDGGLIHVSFEGEEEVMAELKRFGADAPKIFDRILLRVANLFARFIVVQFLSGQALKRRTGRTQRHMLERSVRVAKDVPHAVDILRPPLASIYESRGPIEIKVKAGGWTERRRIKGGITKITKYREAKALRFYDRSGKAVFTRKPVTLKPRAFWTAAIRRFNFEGVFAREADAEMQEEIARRGLA